ncbi:phospholipid transfer protein-like [Stegastes partitus]|uniref:Phospholipid transfer protein-like n=1 Tax=Stegastes partitus TaxID=144197 RepID=A0A9Y4NIZ8_9TELE|nr:PREDICTED: phospholipid transfer protein-like [Stegastes partitus]
MVTIQGSAQGNRLNLPYSNVQCRIVTSNQLKQILVRPMQDLLNDRLSDFLEGWFYGGVPVPLPEGVIFTQGIVEYHNGFVVVGGNLNLTPAGRQALGDRNGR